MALTANLGSQTLTPLDPKGEVDPMSDTTEPALLEANPDELPQWELAECTCPEWCERDHEQD